MPLLRFDVSVQADGREKSIHETLDLPLAAYQDDVAVHPVAWHWHDEFEFFHLLRGNVSFLIGTTRVTLEAGDAVFINAGLLHGAWDNGTGECLYHSLVFHPQLIGGVQTSVFWRKYVDPLRLNRDLPYLLLHPDSTWQREVIGAIEHGWEKMHEQKTGFEFHVRNDLSFAVCEICLHSGEFGRTTTAAQEREEGRVKDMLSFIRTHFAEEITVADIAAAAFVSSTECMRCFRNILHISPNRYLRQQRLVAAEKLLRTTGWRVEEIAERCGFSDMGYFARCFREEYGMTPLKYRKRITSVSQGRIMPEAAQEKNEGSHPPTPRAGRR